MQKDGESCHCPARTLHQLLSPCVRGMRFHKVWGRWMKTQLVSGGPKWPTQCLAVLWQPWGRNGHSYHSCLWASTVYLRERHPTSVLGGFQDLPGESSEQPGLIPELALLWAEGGTGELPRSLPAWIILLSYEELDSFSGREASQHSLGKWPLAERIQMMFPSSVLHRLFSHFFLHADISFYTTLVVQSNYSAGLIDLLIWEHLYQILAALCWESGFAIPCSIQHLLPMTGSKE